MIVVALCWIKKSSGKSRVSLRSAAARGRRPGGGMVCERFFIVGHEKYIIFSWLWTLFPINITLCKRIKKILGVYKSE